MKKLHINYYHPGWCFSTDNPLVMTGLDTIIAKATKFPNVPFIVNTGIMSYITDYVPGHTYKKTDGVDGEGCRYQGNYYRAKVDTTSLPTDTETWDLMSGFINNNPDIYPNTPMGFGTTEEQAIVRQSILDMQAVGCEVIIYIFSGVLGRTIENLRSDIDNIVSLYPSIDGFWIDNYGDSGGVEKINLYCQYINSKLDHPIILANAGPVYQQGWAVGTYPNFPTHYHVVEGGEPTSVSSFQIIASLGYAPIDNLGAIPYQCNEENLTQEYLEGVSQYLGVFGFYGAPFVGYYVNGDLIDYVATFLATVNPALPADPSSITIRGSSDISIETSNDGMAYLYSSAGTARFNPTEQITFKYN